MDRSLISRTVAKAAATAETGTTTYPLIHTTCSPACQSDQSSCNSPVAPTGLPGACRACCCDRSRHFCETCRNHPSPTRFQGTSVRQVNCRNSDIRKSQILLTNLTRQTLPISSAHQTSHTGPSLRPFQSRIARQARLIRPYRYDRTLMTLAVHHDNNCSCHYISPDRS